MDLFPLKQRVLLLTVNCATPVIESKWEKCQIDSYSNTNDDAENLDLIWVVGRVNLILDKMRFLKEEK